ncbi:MAG: Crp/Fnr family transcriptional regulator [Roseibium album]|uniref:Crp/Fnr family transcriptional regulator n=1 Tax=Roseibium album TaxID=311410 RepID=UPI000CF1647F|nr:CRP-like cAMP-binding protein [Labrenzia sp. EL_142]
MFHNSSEIIGVSSAAQKIFARNSKRHVIDNNGIVYLQEDRADRLYIVLSGYVRLSYIMEDGTDILYNIISPGRSFGELGVFENSCYQDTASVVGQVSVLSIRSELFHSEEPGTSEMRAVLGTLVAKRYQDYLELSRCLYRNSLSVRLAMCLVKLIKNLGREVSIGGRLYPYLGEVVTQRDLGAMARGTRGNVNRLLKKWEKHGLVALQDRKIIIRNLSQLEFVASGVGEQ